MLKLATFDSAAIADELCERLCAAGIECESSSEASIENLHGWNRIAVWIPDDANTLLARALAEAFFREIAERSNGTRCIGCGYNLRGHHGKGKCPECARPFRLPDADVRCPNCQEEVPADFETCWNCGAEMSESEP